MRVRVRVLLRRAGRPLPEAIEAAWPEAIVQTCTVHLIRASMRFVSYNDRKSVAKALKPIYTAVNEQAANAAL